MNPLIRIYDESFLCFFRFVHSPLTVIFIGVRRLFVSFSLFLYYNISVACIYRILHKITTQKQRQQRRGMVNPLLFCLLNYPIIFLKLFLSPTVVWFDCTTIHSGLFFLGGCIQRLNFSRQTIDLSRHTVLAIFPRYTYPFFQFDH